MSIHTKFKTLARSLLLFVCLGFSFFFFFLNPFRRHDNTSSYSVFQQPKCSSSLVYNKPHKTASTTIQLHFRNWSAATNRPFYKCSPYIEAASMMMRECVPEDHSGCAVVATHVIMSPVMRSILRKRLGQYLTVTSTRNPRSRLISLYLQHRHTKGFRVKDFNDLKSWLREQNPWELYNYQTGENRHGTCPMTLQERALLPDAVNRYDVVIDAEELIVSNAILRYHGLFDLKNEVKNRRGSDRLLLDRESENLLNKTSCVEEELHRLFRLRMASIYGKARGFHCMQGKRHPKPCF